MPKVALIDDNELTRKIIKESLECYKLKVDSFDSPAKIIHRLQAYDLIVSDWHFESGVTLKFFLESLDPNKLVIVTGSAVIEEGSTKTPWAILTQKGMAHVKCLAVFNKTSLDILPMEIYSILSRLGFLMVLLWHFGE